MSKQKAKRSGKFVGAYINADTKRRIQDLARQQDRPASYIIKNILLAGVTHLEQVNK